MSDPLLDRLTTIPPYRSGAVISDCGKYRYLLWRAWDPHKPTVAFIGFNPSTADATMDDPTIRKCIGFADRLGFGALEMLNLFAYRSPDPAALWWNVPHVKEPIGSHNDAALEYALIRCRTAVAAWGAISVPTRARRILRERIDLVHRLASNHGHSTLACLGRTKAGHPRHPLYVPYTTELEPWRPNA